MGYRTVLRVQGFFFENRHLIVFGEPDLFNFAGFIAKAVPFAILQLLLAAGYVLLFLK